MTREPPHGFPAAQVLVELAVNQPFRTDDKNNRGSLHVCFDKKIKQTAFNNFLLSHTPYRCSLGRQKDSRSDTKQRPKPNDKDRPPDTSSGFCLPKIPIASEELLTGQMFSSEDNLSKRVNRCFIDSQNEDEEPVDFLSCKSILENQKCETNSSRLSVKSKETGLTSLPLISKKRDCSSFRKTCDKYNDLLHQEELSNVQNYYSKTKSIASNRKRKDLSQDQEITTVMEDGARITVYQRRLTIEVFMPRTS